MVDVSSGDKKINITVSTSGNKASVNATPDMAMYYSNKSREWAISNKIVDNEDYSSKYYANESKKQAETVKDKITEVNNAVEEGITNIINQENISVDNVNTAGATQVNLAKEQATIATTQAEIATAKTSEVVESGDNAITAITAQETTSKNNIETKGAEQIELIQNEGATQIANVQSTGFYMRDDKLYYINSQGEETEFKSGGSGLEVCDIGMALYVDETKGLRRYLNGQIVDINTNTQAFLNRLKEITALHPSLLCTEDEWQTAKTMSAFGQVGKFVFNYSGDEVVSVRIPRVVNVQGLFDLQNLGMTVAESLPNIKGETKTKLDNSEGAFTTTGQTSVFGTTSTVTAYNLAFDASYSSSTYQDGAPVQQEAIQYPYFIQIATGSETENNIVNDIELNNPYSLFDSKYSESPLYNSSWLLSNGQWHAKSVYVKAYEALQVEANTSIAQGVTVTLPSGTQYTKRGLSVKLSTQSYNNYDFVLNTSNQTFRLPIKMQHTYLYADDLSTAPVVGNGMTLGLTNGTQDFCIGTVSGSNSRFVCTNTNEVGTAVGSTLTDGALAVSPLDKTFGVTTDPDKSGIVADLSNITTTADMYLYFYVGETVQNANLINAGQLAEQLANKINRTGNETVVERYVNGTSWYRVWSDGWIEQGGYSSTGTSPAEVTFLIPFKDSYTTAISPVVSSNNSRIINRLDTSTLTVLRVLKNNAAVGFYWQACGY